MFSRLFTSKNQNQNIYADILENYAIVSSSEYSEKNLILDIQTLISLPINEQVNILNENFPGIHLEPPKQDWSVLNTISAVMILPVLGYIIKRIIGFFGKKIHNHLQPIHHRAQFLSQSINSPRAWQKQVWVTSLPLVVDRPLAL